MKPLTPLEELTLLHKQTEPPFSGIFNTHFEKGMYLCRQCGVALFRSEYKFDSSCGWPSFDAALPGSVICVPDADGVRTEIICRYCGGHLGHIFYGEGFTPTNQRYCVNSRSLSFLAADNAAGQAATPSASSNNLLEKGGYLEAYFAGGCFWGVEDAFSKVPGVLEVASGYCGGTTQAPTYESVCSEMTGHAETVRVRYNPEQVSYENLAKLFFEIHDPTQLNRQGLDLGTQYRSAIFYCSNKQKEIAENLIKQLGSLGWNVVTQLAPYEYFYEAEPYHQGFTKRTGRGGCHMRVRRFSTGPR